MERNTDRMWWTIGAVVLGGILIAAAIVLLNTTLLPNIKTKVDDLDKSAVTMPNSNLLDGTKDFSGTWTNSSGWTNDGTYNGLTAKKRTGQYGGIYKIFTAPKDGTYTFSAYVKGSGDNARIYRQVGINNTIGSVIPDKLIGNTFDWLRDSFTVSLKANDTIHTKYAISTSDSNSIVWVAGHKWEEGSTATPYMLSASEVGS